MVKSADKVMGMILLDAHGIIFIGYLGKGQTKSGEYYASLLAQLGKEIKKKRLHLEQKKALFH